MRKETEFLSPPNVWQFIRKQKYSHKSNKSPGVYMVGLKQELMDSSMPNTCSSQIPLVLIIVHVLILICSK